MFDIGWSELLVIGVVAIVVVGPKELPRLMRTFGHYTGKLRAMAGDFQRQFEDAVRDTEIDEVRKAMQDIHTQASEVTRAAVDKPLMTPKPAALPAPAEPAAKAKPRARAKKPKPKPDATEMAARNAVAETTTSPENATPKSSLPKNSLPKNSSPKTASTGKPRAKKREKGAS